MFGVCGKNEEVSALQDLLVYILQGISIYAQLANDLGLKDKKTDIFVAEGIFSTVTNVNFSNHKIAKLIYKAHEIKERIKNLFLTEYKNKKGNSFFAPLSAQANFKPQDSLSELIKQGKSTGVISSGVDKDIQSLREILLYGLKGMAAYADHASILGKTDDEVNAFFHKGLSSLANDELSANDYLSLIMEFGKANLRCLEMLDSAHTEYLGHPPCLQKLPLALKRGLQLLYRAMTFMS